MKKWLRRLAIGIVSVYVLLCAAMYFYQEKLLFHPYPIAQDFRYDFPGRYDEFRIHLADGSDLDALHFYTDTPAKGVVIFFHGNGEALDRAGRKAGYFTARGYDCMMVDYSGYGKSTGTISEDNIFNSGLALYDSARAHFPTSRIVIYGMSLGTGVAAHTARDRAWFRSLVLECPYYSITDVGKRRYGFMPIGLLSRYPLSTYQYLRDIQHPTYVIHGTADRVIPVESPRQFRELGLHQFTYIEVPGAGHGNLPQHKEYDEMWDKALN